MGKKDMTSSYRIAQELFKDRLRKQSPETLEVLDDIHAADVIVVKGGYDHIEQVMDSADTPYTLIEPETMDKARLRPDQGSPEPPHRRWTDPPVGCGRA